MVFIRKPTPGRVLTRSLDALDLADKARASDSPARRRKARAALAEARSQLAAAATLAPRPPNGNFSNARHVKLLNRLDEASEALAEGRK